MESEEATLEKISMEQTGLSCLGGAWIGPSRPANTRQMTRPEKRKISKTNICRKEYSSFIAQGMQSLARYLQRLAPASSDYGEQNAYTSWTFPLQKETESNVKPYPPFFAHRFVSIHTSK